MSAFDASFRSAHETVQGRCLDQVIVALGRGFPSQKPRKKVRQLHAQHCGVNGIEAHVIADVLVVVLYLRAMHAERSQHLVDIGIVGGDETCISHRTKVLGGIEAEGCHMAQRAAALAAEFAAERLGCVFYHVKPPIGRNCRYGIHIATLAEQVNVGMMARVRGVIFGLDQLWVDVECNRVDIDEDRSGPHSANRNFSTVAKNVNGGTRTSSPGPIPRA